MRSVDKIIGYLESLPDRMLTSSSSVNCDMASESPGQAVLSAFGLSLSTLSRQQSGKSVSADKVEEKIAYG